MSKTHDDEEEYKNDNRSDDDNECFYESLDRIVSSSCSCSNSNSDTEENDAVSSSASPNHGSVPKFPMGASNKYDVWISEPSSVSERRSCLLRQMGLSNDPSLSRAKPTRDFGFGGDICRSVSSDRLSNHSGASTMVRSKSDGNDRQRDAITTSSSVCSPAPPVISIPRSSPSSGSLVNNNDDNYNCDHAVLVKSRSDNSSGESKSPVASVAGSPNKPPVGKSNSKKVEAIRGDSTGGLDVNFNSNVGGGSGEVEEEGLDCDGVGRESDKVCLIKNLDNGKEFVVNEIREDGMWNKLKEVGTGRQLTMEEFEMSVGHSPIVQELMRRQNVEDGNKDSLDSNANGVGGSGAKMKKKGSWLKSIRNVASSVTGHKERRSSDERDTSSEKGGRRSSSATDDSQDVSFHGPERVKVRQYGKSYKELAALYKSQEIQAHNGSIWTIKFSLDGKYLASAGEDHVIHVWQVVESERKGDLLLEKPDDGNLNLFFVANGSPEPTSLSPGMDNHPEKKRRGRSSISRKSLSLDYVVVPETVFSLSEKPICTFRGHLDDVLDLSWSKSQHLLSSSMDKTVRLWHLSSKSCLKIFSHSDYVTCIQFNPVDDNYFISGSLDAKVRIWSIPDHQVVDWNDLHEMVTAACYTPDGQGALVGSYKGSCRLYNTSDNKLQQKDQINLQNKKKKSNHKKITGFQFAPGSSSEVLITSTDSRIRVVDGVDLVHKFKGNNNNKRKQWGRRENTVRRRWWHRLRRIGVLRRDLKGHYWVGKTSEEVKKESDSAGFRNREKVLVTCSRRINFRYRHLMLNMLSLLPHCKKDNKVESKASKSATLNELVELKGCSSCLFFECRKHQDLYLWMAKCPNGPSVKFLVNAVHTMEELKLTGNHLNGSRPILTFSNNFDKDAHWKILKEMIIQIFGMPKEHRKSKPYHDNVFVFSIVDDHIWFRNYQISVPHNEADKVPRGGLENMTLVEVGPRFCLNPIKIFSELWRTYPIRESILHITKSDSSFGKKEKGWEVCKESQSKDKEKDARAM